MGGSLANGAIAHVCIWHISAGSHSAIRAETSKKMRQLPQRHAGRGL